MKFSRIDPPAHLSTILECYWYVESGDPAPALQKIIPDGYPELIFHFGDPYRIKLGSKWELQADDLLAGQITKFFFLENTGASDILGVKLKPSAAAQLFGVDMSVLTDKVLPLSEIKSASLNSLNQLVRKADNHYDRIKILNEELTKLNKKSSQTQIEMATQHVIDTNGMITVNALCNQCNLTERQVERLFKKHVGLSPKFYARVIRFSNIFQVAKSKKLRWSEVGLEAGFYDQAHFIKNFKSFSGEDPSSYFFDEPTLANFFMKKE